LDGASAAGEGDENANAMHNPTKRNAPSFMRLIL
jgi:hypothetical protein